VKRVAYYTLGCRLNFAETSTLAYRLQQLGFEKVNPRNGEQADLIVVNTCAVTEQATAKSRQQINKLVADHPSAYVIVTGCYAQIEPGQLAERVKGIDVIVGTEFKGDNILNLLGDLQKRDETLVYRTEYKDIHTFHGGCSADDRTRHFLKVQDGCDYFCTYCTIPLARGRSRNGSIAELVEQAKEVVAKGGKEIVLTGVNIGDFGRTTGEQFFDLCRALDQVEGVERYRIGSIEPNLITDEIIHWIAEESQRFAPHFHIPLQAGSDEVLKLMRRRYDTALFAHKIHLIKSIIPDAFIGVDVMAGMRGETAELFDKSYAFLESLPVSQLHPFTYSERSGTKALEIKPIVPMPERHERTARLVALSDQKLRDFYRQQMGATRKVLWEQPPLRKDGTYAPMHGFTDNYIRLQRTFDPALVNVCQEVTLSHELVETNQGPAIQL
jgi:threonylcarbamoyladenosine tRNA methylthiotransferase MtaB